MPPTSADTGYLEGQKKPLELKGEVPKYGTRKGLNNKDFISFVKAKLKGKILTFSYLLP